MKKVINGKRYDTESAREIGWHCYRDPEVDKDWWKETLYRKSTGEYFLHGQGGPESRYSEPIGLDEWEGSERIMPISYEKAREWAKEYLSVLGYYDLFEDAEENAAKRTATFSLKERTIETIARLAADKGISKSEVIERLVDGDLHKDLPTA